MRTWRELAISAPVRTPFIRFCRLATRVLLSARSGHPRLKLNCVAIGSTRKERLESKTQCVFFPFTPLVISH